MPPKTKRGKKEIIVAALDEVRENGFLKLNVRAIARRLDCSTMPIFSVFSGMDELKKAVRISVLPKKSRSFLRYYLWVKKVR